MRVSVEINYRRGQLFWLLWAGFKSVVEDDMQSMNFDQAVGSFLPACSDYDLDYVAKVLRPEIQKLLDSNKLDFASQQVLMHTRERILEEFRRREKSLPVMEAADG